MRKNFGAKPFLYPQPVMILGTYDENGKANASLCCRRVQHQQYGDNSSHHRGGG